jgi:hypothetical protein
MFAPYRQLRRRVWYLLALLPFWSAAQLTFPATAEVDLIFPQNDTYAPTSIMPIVFAIQNSQLLASLDLSFEWSLSNSSNHEYNLASGNLDLINTNSSSSDPYFAYAITFNITAIEGSWMLTWNSRAVNCSTSPSNSTFGAVDQRQFVVFTTKIGAQQPDLVAATADDTCAHSESFTYNVTGVIGVIEDPNKYDSRNSCAVIASTQPDHTPNPCGARVDASAASSISAAITHTACAQLHPIVSCPPTKNDGVRREAQLLVKGTIWLTVTFGWLMSILVL